MAVRTEATEAPALDVLRRTLDARWPQRSRMADRILGQDGDHARGDALDVTRDPVGGPDLERLAAALLRDPRTVVVRWRGRVAEPGVAGGAWRPDPSGSEGGHAAHLHLSIDARRRAWVGPWLEQRTEGDTGHVVGSFDADRAWRALREGERLRIPAAWPEPPAGPRTPLLLPPDTSGPPSTERVYRVAPGDTPLSIARKFGVTPVARPRWLLELSEVNPQKPLEGSVDRQLGEELHIPDAWPPQQVTLSDLRSAKAAPVVAYFSRLGADAEGSFRRYRSTLRPYFQGFGESADGGIVELAAGGIYVAVPGAPGPLGWHQRTAAELHLAPAAVAQLVPVTFWVEPFWKPWPASAAETGRIDDGDSFPTPGFFAGGGEGP
jgi:hypothetical protein